MTRDDDEPSSGGNAERRRRLFEESRGLPDPVELPLDDEETEDGEADHEGRKSARPKREHDAEGGAD